MAWDPEMTMRFKVRELKMYEAGMDEGHGQGSREVVLQLRTSLEASLREAKKQVDPDKQETLKTYNAFREWIRSLDPWINQILEQSKVWNKRSNERLDKIGSTERNLRNRVGNAILRAVDEFKKG